MHAKDGKWRQTTGDAASRHGAVRALIASIGVVAGIGAFLLAPLALSSQLSRRKRPASTELATSALLQQLTRYRAADGSHVIHGTLVAEFEPGDRSTTLHVAFCPPFEQLPTVEARAIDDSYAIIKLTQLLHNGVQIDVRLPASSNQKKSATIQMLATDATDSDA